MPSSESIFPTFFLSGFECSTFDWKDQDRRDLCAETRHYDHVQADYAFLRELGIGVAREGVPWPMVDKGGTLELSILDPFITAVDQGVDLHGVCLFPAIDMPDWHSGKWVHNGIADLVEDNGDLRRVPVVPYIEELRRWQRRLKRVTALDKDPLSDPVNLEDIRAAAPVFKARADDDWH